ncbi:hypothetical protein J2T17_007121 [Paenibacillus mucilaginosus]|uniref:hypothetical protein n=1 Tax=Paenibacillus mucilaginosus TaxID=61624 RepID=UPI003D1DDA23
MSALFYWFLGFVAVGLLAAFIEKVSHGVQPEPIKTITLEEILELGKEKTDVYVSGPVTAAPVREVPLVSAATASPAAASHEPSMLNVLDEVEASIAASGVEAGVEANHQGIVELSQREATISMLLDSMFPEGEEQQTQQPFQASVLSSDMEKSVHDLLTFLNPVASAAETISEIAADAVINGASLLLDMEGHVPPAEEVEMDPAGYDQVAWSAEEIAASIDPELRPVSKHSKKKDNVIPFPGQAESADREVQEEAPYHLPFADYQYIVRHFGKLADTVTTTPAMGPRMAEDVMIGRIECGSDYTFLEFRGYKLTVSGPANPKAFEGETVLVSGYFLSEQRFVVQKCQLAQQAAQKESEAV